MSAVQVSQDLKAKTISAAAPTRSTHRVPSQLDTTFAVLSDDTVEQCTDVDGTILIAYADGRVRAVFPDRTILHTNTALSHCKVTLPDGKTVTVSSSSPVGVEGYVGAVVRFAEWAFLTRAQRQEIRRAHAAVKSELVNSSRMAQLCEYSMHGTLPAASDRFESRARSSIDCEASVVPACSSRGDVHLDRQAAIEQLLKANAELILRM